ncbi:hypothetical protein FRC02_001810 [Tulasnella sp. 418]|nr:hypothetical protein FRC02_001810 [Tulasnella sp. 418]
MKASIASGRWIHFHEASAPKRRNICSSTSSRLSSTSSRGCILKSPFYWKVDTQSPGDASRSSESPINKPSAQQIAGLHTEISQEDRNLMLFTYAWVADGEEDAAEGKETTVDEYELAYFRLKKPRKKRIPKETLPRPWENLKDLDTMIYLDIAVGEDVGEVVIDSWTTNLDGDS